MKTAIIGDVHGRDQWKQIVAQESNADRFVFLGDYFDSFDISGVEQMHNFKEIVEFKETSGKEVILLIGNHDYHYFPEIGESSTSGYQTRMAPSIQQLIYENRQLNDLFNYTPVNLCYRSYKIIDEEKGEWVGSSGFGGETYQGPMWIRPKALMAANRDTLRKEIIQVVGHTHQNEIDKEGKATGGRYYFVDTQETSQEYMIITDGQISFNKTKQ
jgi:predicted phosphodiesterase